MPKELIIPDELVMNKIYFIRGQKVMLDFDLANLYRVETRVLNQSVKRNGDRFPKDFMFRLTKVEWDLLRSQFVTLKAENDSSQFVMSPRKHRAPLYLPYVFTEQGVAMLSGVLRSKIAIRVHIQIIRVFGKMKELLLTQKDILLQLEKIEKKLTGHDEDIALIFQYLKQLLNPSQPARRKIGFRRKGEED